MINYGLKEMDYISEKNEIMRTLVNHYGKLEMGRISDIYVSLVLHMISQMLAKSVADSLINKFINLVDEICPKNVVSVGIDSIRGCGISRKKSEYIYELSCGVLEGKYNFALLQEMTDEEAINYLVQIKGIGIWTAEMLVEFTLGRMNIFSYDDVALQNGIKKAHGFKTLSKIRFERMRKMYSPYCSVASVYYYAFNDDKSGWTIKRDTENIDDSYTFE